MSQSRSTARRHRGRRKLRLYGEPEPVVRLTVPATNPRDAIKYWRGTLPASLFVYFIQHDDGPVKIGRAADPVSRMSELQCGNPYKLTLRAVVVVVNETAEERIHEMWRTAHVRGEWFGNGSEGEIIARARKAQREQIEAHMRRESFGDILEIPYVNLTRTGMQRG